MGMPNDFVLVRHGWSEANVVQGYLKQSDDAMPPENFLGRHDTHMRLTPEGVGQAAITGEWLRSEFPDGFDRYEVSPLVRTVETAGSLALQGAWIKDDRWRERDWGEYSALNETQKKERYELSHRLKQQHEWFWCPPGGESLATGVRLRFEDILDTLHREMAGKRVIAVTHGEMMRVVRYVLERMDPDEWAADITREDRKMNNCQVLHYTRRDPQSGEVTSHVQWFRSVCPWDETKSWNGGNWITIPPRRRYSDDELLESVASHARLFGGNELTY